MDEDQVIPRCIGFIMDGNRRWAKERGLPVYEGHKKGFETLENLIDHVYDAHVPHMVCYAFSTENWNRSSEEVTYLMQLFTEAFKGFTGSRAERRKARIRFIGERERFDKEFQKGMELLEEETQTNAELTVWIALSYGSRAEIVDVVNRAIERGQKVDENTFAQLLWTNNMPDPDLIIRTGGEQRLSNFLLWQSAYSELFFTKTYWPDFGEVEFQSILEAYGRRERRCGV